MPAWNEARRAGQQARSGAQSERAGEGGGKQHLPQAEKRWKAEVCIYCGGKLGRIVGRLPVTGNVYVCQDHIERYREDKEWEGKE